MGSFLDYFEPVMKEKIIDDKKEPVRKVTYILLAFAKSRAKSCFLDKKSALVEYSPSGHGLGSVFWCDAFRCYFSCIWSLKSFIDFTAWLQTGALGDIKSCNGKAAIFSQVGWDPKSDNHQPLNHIMKFPEIAGWVVHQ